MKPIQNTLLNKLYRYFENCDSFVFLDTSKPDERNTTSLLFVNPVNRMQYFEGEDEVEFLDTVQRFKENGNYIAGWFSYEFGYLLESSLKKRLSKNTDRGRLLADLGAFRSCHRFDHVTGKNDFPLDGFSGEEPERFKISNLQPSQQRQQYIEAIKTILDYISAGDTYQVNYTLKLLFDFFGSPEGFYSSLRRNQSVSYGAYIRWHDKRVMSFSPELFFWKSDVDVTVRPMKGTLKRGRTLKEDRENRHFLKNDVKNKSENVMIVDLLRNDLGRLMHHLAEGDVRVDSLFDVETYETLLQMTSTITGSTDRNILRRVSLYNFFKAIFPCGSVTGAPKIRTMEIIDELEGDRRGVYTGAIGYMAPTGEAVFNVPIRTVVLDGDRGEMGIGSGIVHDSDPENEWEECLLKGRFLTSPRKDFSLIETILYHPQKSFWLLDDHLNRLEGSARYFLFSCDIKKIRRDVFSSIKKTAKHAVRVRLTLAKDGSYTITRIDCEEPKHMDLPAKPSSDVAGLPRICLSETKVDSNSCWFYHKTTNREVFKKEYATAQPRDLFDIFFCNETGNITEGCISNIIIYKSGCYYTPPVTDGLLNGVMRQYLLENCPYPLKEKSLKINDMKEADAIFMCNSVRGVVQVKL